jgi:hypothetical protein
VQRINLMLLWVLQSQHLHACCIHVCPYLPVRSPSPHTFLKRPCVSTGQPCFAHKQNTDFFAGPSFESCICTVACPSDRIWLTEFNSICCLLPLFGHCNYSTQVTSLNEVVSTVHTVSNDPAHYSILLSLDVLTSFLRLQKQDKPQTSS